VTLTIIESAKNIMTPQLQQMFLSIHLSILCVFFAEFMYRFWKAPQIYNDCSVMRARFNFLINPFTILDIIVIAPLFAMIWTQNLHDADGVILRLLRFTTMLNMFHFYRSSRVIKLVRDMSREIWYEMMIVFILSLQCIVVSGVLFYIMEHEPVNMKVHNMFDGIWWAVTTLTTIGYGDIVPVTIL
jgi:voltage-gated potassium channel